MARSFNQVILVGNMARDPELRSTQNGRSVASFAVATNRSWQDQNGDIQEQADFHNIVVWEKLAELAEQYLSKGRRVMVVGRLQTRSWDGEDGKKNYRTEIVASELNFLDRPGDDSSSGSTASEPSKASSDESSSKDSSDKSAKKKDTKKDTKKEDVKIEDLDDEVDLSEVPF